MLVLCSCSVLERGMYVAGSAQDWEELRGKATTRAAKPAAALHCWGGCYSSCEDLGDHICL